MKRVIVIGSPGTGKTTFSRKLAAKTGLPLIHLDYYYHNKKTNFHNNRDAWIAHVKELLKGDEWIIDGNYSSTLTERSERADAIIFFDLPRRQAVQGILKRRVKFRNKKREDMPDDWKEGFDAEFLKHVWTFKKKYYPKIENTVGLQNKKMIVFKTRKQADDYLKMLW